MRGGQREGQGRSVRRGERVRCRTGLCLNIVGMTGAPNPLPSPVWVRPFLCLPVVVKVGPGAGNPGLSRPNPPQRTCVGFELGVVVGRRVGGSDGVWVGPVGARLGGRVGRAVGSCVRRVVRGLRSRIRP